MRLAPEALAALRRAAALARGPVWLVGGALRDAALGRPVKDLDLACRGAEALARALCRELGAAFVPLDPESGVYRAALPPRAGRALAQVDVAELQGSGIEEDLARRDFTMNALAAPLSARMAAEPLGLLDPRGGMKDLARRLVRCEEDRLLKEDPLRLLRARRLAAQLGLKVEPKTAARLKRLRGLALKPAPERIWAELEAMLALPGASATLRALDGDGLLTAVFPELAPARACARSYYGPGGVLEHTLRVCDRLDFLLSAPGAAWPALAGPVERLLAEGGPRARAGLLIAALLHDVAKPETARRLAGRLRFLEHDTIGAERAGEILTRLKAPGDMRESVRAVVRHHLRPGHLAASGALTEKAAYRFFRDLGPRAPALVLVAWADHASHLPPERLKANLAAARAPLSAPPPKRLAPEAAKTVLHLRLVAELARRAFGPGPAPVPAPLLDGRAVMKLLGIPPGPAVGKALEALREAQAEGRVEDARSAEAFLKRLDLSAARP